MRQGRARARVRRTGHPAGTGRCETELAYDQADNVITVRLPTRGLPALLPVRIALAQSPPGWLQEYNHPQPLSDRQGPTHQQVDQISLAVHLADVCKRHPARCSALVRAGDQLRAQGVPEEHVNDAGQDSPLCRRPCRPGHAGRSRHA